MRCRVGSPGKTPLHGVADEPRFVPGRGWVRSCKCGREFVSEQNWQHVPALFDHLAIAPQQDARRG